MNEFRTIKAEALVIGDVLALPMGRTATIKAVTVGRRYINFVTEHGPGRQIREAEIQVMNPQEDAPQKVRIDPSVGVTSRQDIYNALEAVFERLNDLLDDVQGLRDELDRIEGIK